MNAKIDSSQKLFFTGAFLKTFFRIKLFCPEGIMNVRATASINLKHAG